MKLYIPILLFLLFPGVANAQIDSAIKKKPQYTLNITASPQLFLNACNVKNDGIYPETITARNTGGYTLGLEIERKSRHGLILNAALQYGKQYHNLSIGYQSLDFFDPTMPLEFDDLSPMINHFKASSAYVNLRLQVGYVLPVKILNDYNIEVKAGASLRVYIRKFDYFNSTSLQFMKNDSIFIWTLSNQNLLLGNDYPPYSYSQTAEGYIGISKELNHKWVKNIKIGFELTRSIIINGESSGSGFATVTTYALYHTKPISIDKYDGKDFSIGLRLAVGLWRKSG